MRADRQEQLNWVQCDDCNAWRIVRDPPRDDAAFVCALLPTKQCGMADDRADDFLVGGGGAPPPEVDLSPPWERAVAWERKATAWADFAEAAVAEATGR